MPPSRPSPCCMQAALAHSPFSESKFMLLLLQLHSNQQELGVNRFRTGFAGTSATAKLSQDGGLDCRAHTAAKHTLES